MYSIQQIKQRGRHGESDMAWPGLTQYEPAAPLSVKNIHRKFNFNLKGGLEPCAVAQDSSPFGRDGSGENQILSFRVFFGLINLVITSREYYLQRELACLQRMPSVGPCELSACEQVP